MIEIGYEVGKFVVQKIAPRIYERLRETALSKKEVPRGIIIINASGHPLSEKAEDVFKERYGAETIVDISIPNADVEDLVPSAENILKAAAENCGKKLLTGEYVLVPPGFSPLAIVTIAMLHGVSGHFPLLHPLKKAVIGFVPTDNAYDLQIIRTENRNAR